MSVQQLASYSPLDVAVIISQPSSGFTHKIVGFMADSFVSVERDSDTWTHETGVDNFATRTYMANTSGKFTLSLQQTSPSNDILTQLYNRDASSRNNSGLFEITVKDGSGRSVYSSTQAYIGKVPNSSFGSAVQGRDWVINAPRVLSNIGGNSLMVDEDVSSLTAIGGSVAADQRL